MVGHIIAMSMLDNPRVLVCVSRLPCVSTSCRYTTPSTCASGDGFRPSGRQNNLLARKKQTLLTVANVADVKGGRTNPTCLTSFILTYFIFRKKINRIRRVNSTCIDNKIPKQVPLFASDGLENKRIFSDVSSPSGSA